MKFSQVIDTYLHVNVLASNTPVHHVSLVQSFHRLENLEKQQAALVFRVVFLRLYYIIHKRNRTDSLG